LQSLQHLLQAFANQRMVVNDENFHNLRLDK
jgi:hypothetical protein